MKIFTKRRNSFFSHFNLSKTTCYCTIYLWENAEQCGLFICRCS